MMMDERSRFAGSAVALFAVSTFIVILLGLLEEQRWISAETEGLVRLIVGAAVANIILILALRAQLALPYRILIAAGCIAAQLEYLLSYTEDVAGLNEVPILGLNSEIRKVLEPLLTAIWMLATLSIAQMSIRAIRAAHTKSANDIIALEDSEARLNTLNQHLEQTIRELNSAQQQLVEQEKMRAIGEMASGVAHDLNNALTPLVSSSQLLIASLIDPTNAQVNLAEQQKTAILDLSATINRIIHIHNEHGSSKRKKTNLKGLLEQVVSGTRAKWKLEPELSGAKISVTVCAQDLAAIVDPTDIRMILTNLLFNSVQAMPEGGTIDLKLSKDGEQAVFAVHDSGQGMTPETLSECREPFFSTKSAGSGLGLAMCQRIANSYGTNIDIESTPGRGTLVQFRVPVSDPPEPSTSRQKSLVAHKRILVVEDDGVVRKAIGDMLKHLGMEVSSANSGIEAIKQTEESDFDLIITDFGMAGITGADVVRTIRRSHPSQRIAVLSGWAESTISDRFFDGFEPDAVLQKPVDLDDLELLLTRW